MEEIVVGDETGRFIPVAPGWIADQYWKDGGTTEKVSDDLVGWFLVDGKSSQWYVPVVWGENGRLEPLLYSLEEPDTYALQFVRVRRAGNPRT